MCAFPVPRHLCTQAGCPRQKPSPEASPQGHLDIGQGECSGIHESRRWGGGLGGCVARGQRTWPLGLCSGNLSGFPTVPGVQGPVSNEGKSVESEDLVKSSRVSPSGRGPEPRTAAGKEPGPGHKGKQNHSRMTQTFHNWTFENKLFHRESGLFNQ